MTLMGFDLLCLVTIVTKHQRYEKLIFFVIMCLQEEQISFNFLPLVELKIETCDLTFDRSTDNLDQT